MNIANLFQNLEAINDYKIVVFIAILETDISIHITNIFSEW